MNDIQPVSTRRSGRQRRSADCEKCGARMLARKEVLCGRETERGRIVCREPVCVVCETLVTRLATAPNFIVHIAAGPRFVDLELVHTERGLKPKRVEAVCLSRDGAGADAVLAEVMAALDGLARVLGMVSRCG